MKILNNKKNQIKIKMKKYNFRIIIGNIINNNRKRITILSKLGFSQEINMKIKMNLMNLLIQLKSF